MEDVMRRNPKQLDQIDVDNINAIKDAGNAFVEALKEAGRNAFPSREMSLAITNAEQSVMWAVKAISR